MEKQYWYAPPKGKILKAILKYKMQSQNNNNNSN